MQTITYANVNGSLSLGANTTPYFLQNIEGVTGITVDILSQTAPFQQGTTYIRSDFRPRNITIRGLITATDYTTLNTRKRLIQNLFNPKLVSTITYTNDYFTAVSGCYPEMAPAFTQSDQSLYFQTFFVSLICPNPFWRDATAYGTWMSISIPKLKFDLELTDTYEFETNGTNRMTIDNVGDVETSVIIYFHGAAINPRVDNLTTGEHIKVTKTLADGEALVINTEFGNKSVLFDDGLTQTNAFGLIDLSSTFFQLQVGENILAYSADTGVETASVLVQYYTRYLGM